MTGSRVCFRPPRHDYHTKSAVLNVFFCNIYWEKCLSCLWIFIDRVEHESHDYCHWLFAPRKVRILHFACQDGLHNFPVCVFFMTDSSMLYCRLRSTTAKGSTSPLDTMRPDPESSAMTGESLRKLQLQVFDNGWSVSLVKQCSGSTNIHDLKVSMSWFCWNVKFAMSVVVIFKDKLLIWTNILNWRRLCLFKFN